MKRVTGIGGIFFKSKDPQKLRDWYQKHLGIDMLPYGAQINTAENQAGYTLWSPFSETSNYFEPSTKDFMINFTVENLDALVPILKEEGIEFLNEMMDSEYGKFIHLLDIEGNKVELWQPPIN